LPSPDSATHFVSSASTFSSTAWPRCFASRIDQITIPAWWHETQLCSFFQAIASLARKAKPRSIVVPTLDALGRMSSANADPESATKTTATIDRISLTPGPSNLQLENPGSASIGQVQSIQAIGDSQRFSVPTGLAAVRAREGLLSARGVESSG